MNIRIAALGAIMLVVAPSLALAGAQQDKMKSCNTEAAGKKGQERKDFMKTCLAASTDVPAAGPHCTTGKACGDGCIPADKVCHK